MRLSGDESVAAAARLAGVAHHDQVDKEGRHRTSITRAAWPAGGRLAAETVAWLHDVVEDTA